MSVKSVFTTAATNLMDMDANDAKFIISARSWFLLRGAQENPLPRITGILSSTTKALRFSILMEAVQQAWPQPFAIHRPCCCLASIDEILLAQITRLGATRNRVGFDILLKEIIGEDGRNLIYARSSQLALEFGAKFTATSAG